MSNIKSKYILILSFFAIIPFLVISMSINGVQNNYAIDNYIWETVRNIRSSNLNFIMTTITHLADSLFLTILVTFIALVLICKYKLYKITLWLVSVIVLGAVVLNKVLKHFYARPRPFEQGLIENLVYESSYSYPSGHAMGSIIVYLSLAYLLTKLIKDRCKKTILICFSIVFSLIICVTRVYVGVHYPTDVIAGFSLGLCCTLISILVYRKVFAGESYEN